MASERGAGFTAFAIDDVDDAVRHAGLLEQGHEAHGGQRGLLGSLDDDAVAGRERGREALRQDHQRMVERGHQRAHAKRHALGVAEVRPFDGDHVAAARQGERGEVAVELRQARDLRARLDERTAVIERLELVEVLEVGLEQVGEFVEDARTLCARTCRARRHARTHRTRSSRARSTSASEAAARLPITAPVAGLMMVHRLARRRIDKLAVDEQLRVEVLLVHCVHLCFSMNYFSVDLSGAPGEPPLGADRGWTVPAGFPSRRWPVGSTPSHATTRIWIASSPIISASTPTMP